jgi:hypothetical protein
MRNYLANALSHLSDWLRPKAMPAVLTGGQWGGGSYIDAPAAIARRRPTKSSPS